MATIPTILNVYPSPDAVGIPISDQIFVIFDQEMDETTINTGTFVVTGLDKSTVFSPTDITPFDIAGFNDEEVNSSPYIVGYVKGTITFEKVDVSGGAVDDSTKDYTGTGTSWCTKAIFTPDAPLEPNREYTVTLAGDETPDDAFDSGIKTRTVFDTEKTSGTGTAFLNFDGGYTGTSIRSYTVRFTSGGVVGTAEYEWWDNNDPLTVYEGISSTGDRELEDGIFVYCDPDGSFTTGDTFTVVCIPAEVLEDNYRWTFSTGTGAIKTPSSTYSTSGIDATAAETSTSSFYVSSIDPEDKEYGVAISEDLYVGEVITITFSLPVDSDTVNEDTLRVHSEVANGDPINEDVTGELEYTYNIADNTITVELDPGQLYENNIIVITLASTLSSTTGISLGAEYISYFSTTYNPLYTGIRRIQLDLGNLIANVPEETIMLAILEASLMADVTSFTTTHTNQAYFEFARREFTTCLAELILVRGIAGDSSVNSRMTKTLGDLQVSRGPGDISLSDRMAKLEDCMAKWQVPLQTGGLVTPGASLLPQVAVKGSTAEDAIAIYRQWEPTSGIGFSSVPAANDNLTYFSGRRRLRTFRSRF